MSKMRFCAVDTGLFFIITSSFFLLLFFFFLFAGEADLPSYGTVFLFGTRLSFYCPFGTRKQVCLPLMQMQTPQNA